VPSEILVTGFAVPEFELHAEAGTQTTFRWDAPPGATRVVCGLFVAEPEIAPSGDPDHPEYRITNDFKSVFRTHVFRVPTSAADAERTVRFTVSDLSTRPGASCPQAGSLAVTPMGVFYPQVTTLQVGCWALDDAKVIAATRLRNLRLTDLPEVRPPVVDCAELIEETPSGRLCLLAPMVGTCRAGACLPNAPRDAGEIADPTRDGGVTPAELTVPVETCEPADTEGKLCQLTSRFRFGRCVGNRCADQELREAELPLVTADCAGRGETNWLNCFDDQVQGYGTCFDRTCRLRCTSDTDCGKVDRFLGRQNGPQFFCAKRMAGQFPCRPGPGQSFVGLCMPEEPLQCR
jgi:hypothetical protein